MNYTNNLFFLIIVRILKALKFILSTEYFVSEFIYAAADNVQSTGLPITAPAVPSTQGKTNVLPSKIVLSWMPSPSNFFFLLSVVVLLYFVLFSTEHLNHSF